MRLFCIVTLITMLIHGAATGQPAGGEPVTFATKDLNGTAIQLRGQFYRLSAGAEKAHVVLVHGSSGWSDFREGHYARALNTAGYSVLAIDAFGPRGLASTAEDQAKLTTTQMTLDALSARRYLIQQGATAERMAIMGFSKGGLVSLYNADRTMLPAEVDRFPVAIPFYPGCSNRPRQPKPASIIFMVLGEKDDYTGVKPCQDLAADYSRAGGDVRIKIYPGASHGFDGNPANTLMYRERFVENYMDCIVFVEPDGTQTYGSSKFAPADPAIYSELRRSCMRKGASIWTNAEQKAKATRDVISFLDTMFGQR
jgi:dienelactone hydrolase